MHKAKWTGSTRRIPDLDGIILEAGDEFDLPEDLHLGGEGTIYHIVGGPAFEEAKTAAGAAGLKTPKAATRKDNADALEAHQLILEAQAEAEKADAQTEDTT